MRLKHTLPTAILLMAPAAIAFLILLSVLYGAKSIHAQTVWDAVFHFDRSNVDHQIVRASRMPRVVGAMLIGCFLAISGALMQGMTRNYLASPSIMGVSDGSVFFVTLAMVWLPSTHSLSMIGISMLGSAFGSIVVFGLAWLIPQGMTPVKLAIIGTIVGVFLNGVADAVATYNQISQSISFWYNARLYQMDPEMIKLAIPFAIVGIGLAVGLSRSITVLSLGEELSAGLGQRTALVKGLSMLAVVLLTGVSVALAGQVAFVGLIIPHVARMLSGQDYRWIIPISGVLGGLFLALCDVLARFVNYPFETPIGVVTALFGVPFFLYLIWTRGGGQRV
ncbi:FecCD family ABC transporter permease [Paenibacillus xylaniclasticus]|uniref:FecCD family ABC transporter permease n=1 Tax=Paenibacillus xylaniclasticus TaxID=588083 RepID=UPI000FDBBFAE|nr:MULTISPECIES: iron ABC transporter permease [Paenibacillus]GFN29887.1 ferrichrome ABC transporter permease [Paenibacillus curdlanolyticus]